MTPEAMAKLVAWWTRFYTRNLPAPIGRRRIDEVDADLHDNIAHERDHGTDDWRIALRIASRMLRGIAADVSWRRRTIVRSSTSKDVMKVSRTPYRSALRVALVTTVVLLVPLVAMQFTDEVNWSLSDFGLAAVLLGGAGLLLELAVKSPSRIAYRAATTAVGVAAIVLGEADDAPGLVLFGLLLIVGTVALTVRMARGGA